MDRLIGALVLLVGPAVGLWCAAKPPDTSAWRRLLAAMLGGAGSGATLFVGGMVVDPQGLIPPGSTTPVGDLVLATVGMPLSGAGVGAIIGAVVLAVRAWLRSPAPGAGEQSSGDAVS